MNALIIFLVCLFSFILGRNFNKIKKKLSHSNKNTKKNDDNNKSNDDKDEKKYIFDDSDDLKMVFLVRQDLKMGAGKIAAQVAHAAIGLYDDILDSTNDYQKNALDYWFNLGQKKVVLKADNLEIMIETVKKCKELKLQNCMITDAGHTQIPAGSITVLGIGPDTSEKINKVTGSFKLMN